MHYWRHKPERWPELLQKLKSLGLSIVDTYVPWGIHEIAKGDFDFGSKTASNNVRAFLLEAKKLGLYVIFRPGPHINAELTYFGLPKRIVWDETMQARSPEGNPVVLPMIPTAFPVPSYASDLFHEECAVWFRALGKELADLVYPAGPIVLVQVDNEGAMYFRDGLYDQDYHPDAIARFRSFLRAKYQVVAALRSAWKIDDATFEAADPPRRMDAASRSELPRHLDWAEFQEQLLAWALRRMRNTLDQVGFGSLPTVHNFPPGEAGTALNAARLPVDMIGLDYYHQITPNDVRTIMRRTTELTARAAVTKTCSFSSEMGVGGPPFLAPFSENDSLVTLVSALAFGLRGFNLYMAIDRDRWIGGAIERHGRERSVAKKIRELMAVLEDIKFDSLRRPVPVWLVVPRAMRRLARVMHAFGPVTPAFFNLLGVGFSESCLEDDFELGDTTPIAGEQFLRAFEYSLLEQGVPFAYVPGESIADSLASVPDEGLPEWIVCAAGGILKRDLISSLAHLRSRGPLVSLGPSLPYLDPDTKLEEEDLQGIELVDLRDATEIERLVGKRIQERSIVTYAASPTSILTTVHSEVPTAGRAGAPSVVFALNPDDHPIEARLVLQGITNLAPLYSTGQTSPTCTRQAGAFSMRIPPKTVWMFRVT